MAKSFSHAALDAAFAHIADRADLMTLCESAPSTYAEASALKSAGGARLGGIAMALGLAGGDYTVAPGDVSGRKLIIAAQTGVPVLESGTVDHLALLDTTDGALLLVTALSSAVVVEAGRTVSVASFADEIQDSS